MHEIQDVLGRIHEQKNFYAKFKDGQTYEYDGCRVMSMIRTDGNLLDMIHKKNG